MIKKLNGIPLLETKSVSISGTDVIYQLCSCCFKWLPCQGVLLIKIAQSNTGASTDTVSLQINNTYPLINSAGTQITNTLVEGSYILIYYNKCNSIFQVL